MPLVDDKGNPLTARADQPMPKAEFMDILPPAFKPVAQRHGEELFRLCMTARVSNISFGILRRRLQGNRELWPACQNLINQMDGLSKTLLNKMEKSIAEFNECSMDIDRAEALMNAKQGSAVYLN